MLSNSDKDYKNKRNFHEHLTAFKRFIRRYLRFANTKLKAVINNYLEKGIDCLSSKNLFLRCDI